MAYAHSEGMLAFCHSASVEIKADIGKQHILHFFLGVNVVMAFKRRQIRHACGSYFGKQRQQPFLHFIKNPVDGGAVHPFLVHIKQHLIGIFFRFHVSHVLPGHGNHFIQPGRKEREIPGPLCFLPHLFRSRGGGHIIRIKILGNALKALIIP